MAKEQFQQDLEAMLQAGSGEKTLAQVLDGLIVLLIHHEDTFAGVTYRYRLLASDTGTSRAFALEDGKYAALSDTDEVDVTISAKEKTLLQIFNKEIKPAAALLTGKLKVKGSLAALNTLASFL